MYPLEFCVVVNAEMLAAYLIALFWRMYYANEKLLLDEIELDNMIIRGLRLVARD